MSSLKIDSRKINSEWKVDKKNVFKAEIAAPMMSREK